MNKSATLALGILLGSLMGCGGQGTPPSAAAPKTTPEEDMKTIEKAMDSGQIDPSSYGK